jgi:anti-sigma regulatory factor (Ser/Thr protein kinase)
MKLKIELHLRSGPLAPAFSRKAVSTLEDYVEPDALDSIRLLVSELVTNAFRHGSAGDGEDITLVIKAAPDLVRCEVVDSGPGLESAEPALTDDQTSGWGLYLVEQLADRWGVSTSGGGSVWFEVDHEAETFATAV